ncbi:polyphosphate polymerase domain-containing protein [Nucisporomicrobium flavum]|uniref:polyphosphate polymerase domain-containing protein n=1 Tax=Nucisporomicrobium flavum TaxID=2785915 RepID=UPI003C2C5CEA
MRPLETLPAVGLAELEERAALLTRVDRKYLVPLDEAGWLVDTLAPDAAVLEIDERRRFAYESLYFDTAGLSSYLRTAYRHRRRFKTRIRTYADSGESWLEVKVPGPRGSTVKYRVPHEPEQSGVGAGRDFVDGVFSRHGIAVSSAELRPVLRSAYRRFTLVIPGDSRVTVDTRLRWTAAGRELRLSHLAVVESKTGSAASAADRHLWRRGYRPVAISKYATGLAALRSDLPAAPWRRVLRQHFACAAKERTND